MPPPDPVRKAAGIPLLHRAEEPGGLPAVAGMLHEVRDRPVAEPVQPPPGRLADPAQEREVGKDGRGCPVRVPAVEAHGAPGLDDIACAGGGGNLPAAEDILDAPAVVSGDEVVVEPPGLPELLCLLKRVYHCRQRGRPSRHSNVTAAW